LEASPFATAASSSALQSVFDNGLALNRTDWIADGVLNSLMSSQYSANKADLPVAPYIDNLILEGKDADSGKSLTEMVSSTERGLLLTCLWYVRMVEPKTLTLTGLTRDGVYLVENGEVVSAVNNFRFNESPVELLRRTTEVGRTEHTLPREFNSQFTRVAMPTLRVEGFNMSSVSEAS